MMTNIEKTNGFDTLGFQLLAVFYLCMMIGSTVGSGITKIIGLKSTFIVGYFGLSFMVGFQMLPAWRA